MSLQRSPELMYVKPAHCPVWVLWLLLLVSTSVTFYEAFLVGTFPDYAKWSAVLLSLLSFLFAVFFMPRLFTVGFLVSLLPFLISWRVAAMLDVRSVMMADTVVFLCFVLLFFDAMRNDWRHFHQNGWFEHVHWQMSALRIYFGFDMVGHFTEKLFAGQDIFTHMVGVFESLGLTQAAPVVMIGGLAELGIAIGIGCGVFTRLAAVCAAAYFLIANHFGQHFLLGFTWANQGGGWEYPVLMILFYLSFVLTGAGKFSVDAWLLARGWLPKCLIPLCFSKP